MASRPCSQVFSAAVSSRLPSPHSMTGMRTQSCRAAYAGRSAKPVASATNAARMRSGRRMSGTTSPDLDRVVLDHRIGEKLPAHFLDPGARRGGIGIAQLQFDQLALADLADPREAQRLQCIADRLALRIEHAGFKTDMNARFHRCLSSPGGCMSRLN